MLFHLSFGSIVKPFKATFQFRICIVHLADVFGGQVEAFEQRIVA